jgi:hypothetical protein
MIRFSFLLRIQRMRFSEGTGHHVDIARDKGHLLAPALGALRFHGFMLGDCFGAFKLLPALLATILVGRRGLESSNEPLLVFRDEPWYQRAWLLPVNLPTIRERRGFLIMPRSCPSGDISSSSSCIKAFFFE